MFMYIYILILISNVITYNVGVVALSCVVIGLACMLIVVSMSYHSFI